MNREQIKKYLDRIGYRDEPVTDHASLSKLQLQHLLTVPFENLDIHAHRTIAIDTAAFYEKIVVNKRGGFCYELNGLFGELLASIGFTTTIVSARVFSDQEHYGEEYDHLCLVIHLDNEPWLVDVGFGSFSLEPIKIDNSVITTDPAGLFKTDWFKEQYLVVQKMEEGVWKNQYLFNPRAREIHEFAGMCHYHQTSSQSHFTQKKLCSIATKNGRITLTNNSLKITQDGRVTEKAITGEDHFKMLLQEYFEIRL